MINISRLDKNNLIARADNWDDQMIVKAGVYEWSHSERAYIIPRYRIVEIVDTCKKEDLKMGTAPEDEHRRTGNYPEDLYKMEKMGKIAFESTLAALRAIRQTGCRAEDIDYFREYFNGKFPPYRHQLVTFQYIDLIDQVAVFNEMGTGKTASVLWAIDWRLKTKRIYSALVVAPNNVLRNWEKEASFHTPRLKVISLQGTRGDRLDLLETIADIYLINYEGLRVIGEELKDRFQMVVLDEAHKIKDPTATQTKLCFELFEHVQYKVAMTGTPIGNNLIDLHQLITWLDPYMFEPFYIFRAHWFYNIGYKWFPNKQNANGVSTEKMMQDKVYTRAIRYRKDECLDLPPKTYQVRTCVLEPVQAQAYRQMQKAMISLIEDGFITAKNVLSQIVKLSEITSGFIRNEEGIDHVFRKSAKLDLLSTIVDEIGPGHKIVHWARYIPDIKRIGKMLEEKERGVVLLYGATSKGGKAQDIVDKFQDDPSITDIVGNPAVGGLGLNMTAADYAIYYSNDYSWIKRSQSEDRIHRMGSEKHKNITIIDLCCELAPGVSTIDMPVVKSLTDKKELAKVIIDLYRAGINDSFSLLKDKKEAEQRLVAAAKNLAEVDSIIDFSLPMYQGAITLDEPSCPSCRSKNVGRNELTDGLLCRDCQLSYE